VNGFLFISSNPSFTNLSGLSSLTLVNGDLSISSNPSLTNLNGLSSLTEVNGSLTIQNNPSLTSLSGLSALTQLNGRLNIYNNPSLTNLNGLSSLTQLNGSLAIFSNNSITIDFTDIEFYIGSITFDSSNLTLKSTKFIILSNFFLNNSIINIDSNSSITVNQCLYLTNSTLLINLDGEHNNNKTIISFKSSCSNTSNLKYSFYNYSTDFCPSLDVESNSLSVLFVNCNNNKKGVDNSITWIILAVLGSFIL